MAYKIGSLFDGSGGFPLAGSLCGMEPVWAAEVEPYPIAVTRSRFPHMIHLGSVTDINGGEIPPVDIITFGSPCQDLSVAGKRAGLKHEANGDEETTRSGLFMEAVRIIKEMRKATNGKYPTFALWENVPGAFSSNKGEDFRTVCEELIKIVEPDAVMPEVPKNGWPYADSYVGDGWSLAYRTFDAQYWGVPQRRRRIHLVADFRGERAREVLFEREGVRGYFETSRTPWEGAAPDAEGRPASDDRAGESTGGTSRGLDAVKAYGIVSKGNGEAWPIEEKHMALSCGEGQAGQGFPCVMEPVPYTLKIRSGVAVDSNGKAAGKGALIQTDKAATLAATQDPYLFQPVGLLDSIGWEEETAPTLLAGQEPAVCIKCFDARGNGDGETVPTLTGDHQNRVTDYTAVVCEKTPVICLQGNGIDRADTAGCNGAGWREDASYTLNTIDRPAVAYCTDIGFFQSQEEKYPTLLARMYKDPHLVTYPETAVCYIVRRLTPTECARLQGFPDLWGHPDQKTELTEEEYQFWLGVRNTHATINGKVVKDYTSEQMLKWYSGLHTDSAEYKMWGNGIALPPALYIMQGMADALDKEDEDAWLL